MTTSRIRAGIWTPSIKWKTLFINFKQVYWIFKQQLVNKMSPSSIERLSSPIADLCFVKQYSLSFLWLCFHSSQGKVGVFPWGDECPCDRNKFRTNLISGPDSPYLSRSLWNFVYIDYSSQKMTLLYIIFLQPTVPILGNLLISTWLSLYLRSFCPI